MIDTDFLSAFLKVKEIELVLDFFKEEKVYIPVAVQKEIADTDLLPELNKKDRIKVVEVNDIEVEGETDLLGAGELECMALCDKDDLLLMNDKKAGEIADNNNISVTNIPGFLLALKSEEFVDKERIKEIKRKLERRDYYSFSEKVEKELT